MSRRKRSTGGWEPLPEKRRDDPVRVNALLDGMADRIGAPRTDVIAAIFGHWPDLVGEAVAAHTRPLRLRDGRLVVQADDGAWATQLRYLLADLGDRIAERVGTAEVREVVVQVGRGGGTSSGPPRPRHGSG